MKAWLSRVGVPFTERNVEEDEVAFEELMALGYRAVPVTRIGDRFVRGFDEAALRQALEEARGD